MGQFTPAWLARLKVERQNKREPLISRPAPREQDIHDAIEAFCRARSWIYVHSRMDKRTTCTSGTPDFIVFADRGRQFNIEAKRPGAKLRLEQMGFEAHMARLGHTYHVVHSLKEFEEVVT